MKKVYLLILMLLPLCAGTLFAQTDSRMEVERLIEFYSSKNSVESVDISPKFMAMIAGQSGGDKELFSKIGGIKVISMSNEGNTKEAVSMMMEQMRVAVKKDEYNQIMRVKSDGSLVEMHTRDSTLLFLVHDDTEGVVLYINGNIDAELIKAVMDGQISIK